MYNLGNTLSQQQKFQEAMEQYDSASKIEKDKMNTVFHDLQDCCATTFCRHPQLLHNLYQLEKAPPYYGKCVPISFYPFLFCWQNHIAPWLPETFVDPADHETRYNLALAQKMLKDQQNQQDQDQNQDQNKDALNNLLLFLHFVLYVFLILHYRIK